MFPGMPPICNSMAKVPISITCSPACQTSVGSLSNDSTFMPAASICSWLCRNASIPSIRGP